MAEQITVADGKYTIINDSGKLTALRHGQPWGRDLVGDNLVYWMMVEIQRLQAASGQAGVLAAENERLRTALRFYAHGEHYSTDDDEDFDTVSGEPQNWLCSGLDNSATMIEDGSVARVTLLGETINWIDGGEDTTPKPIEGEHVRGAHLAGALDIVIAARECLATELGEMACTGSDAPAEHALGLLADAVRAIS